MNLSRNKKLFFLGLILALLIALPLTLYILQKQQETRSKAQASTTLSLTPSSTSSTPLQKNIGDEFTLTIAIDPGANLVSATSLEITYDPSVFEPSGTQPFTLNPAALPIILQGPIYSTGKMQIALSAGSDPTRALSASTNLGTLKLKTLNNTSSPSVIRFGEGTVVSSIAETDSFSENVLSASNPAFVQVGSPTTCAPRPTGPAGVTYFSSTLSGNQEVPPVSTQATGDGQVILNAAETSAEVYLCVSGLSSSQTAAHIHGPATSGQEAGVIFTLPNGSFTTHTINGLTATQVQQLKNGLWYFNVHTGNFPDGEIRGQIIASNPTSALTPTLTPTPTNTPPSPTIPTSTPLPTPSFPPGTAASISVFLHGIGRAGDNSNPTNFSTSNKNPLHPTRNMTIEMLNSTNQVVLTTSAQFVYNPLGGYFYGIFPIPNTISTGNYLVLVKSSGYLRKFLFGNQSVTSGASNGFSSVTLVAGDIDDNNFVNALDYGALYDCGYGDLDPLPMTDPASSFNTASCQGHANAANADMNDDGIIDQKDFNLFIREISSFGGD